ncbi:MAG: hypothetical protein J6A15_08475 [Clostridia bacterium]|nr:hypothetical protein [Clostridia bacterium]
MEKIENEIYNNDIIKEPVIKKKKGRNLILWTIGVFFILSSLVYMSEMIIPSVLIGLAGIILLPPVREKMNNKIKNLCWVLEFIFIISFFSNINNTTLITPNVEVTNINMSSGLEASDSGKYTGNVVDGKRQGEGKYVWDDGTIYEGTFENNTISGTGKLTSPTGDVYEGEFKLGKKNGKGKYTFNNGDVYEGDFLDDYMSGNGKYIFSSGDIYEGEFSNNKFNGEGTYIKDGVEYSGTWKNNSYLK